MGGVHDGTEHWVQFGTTVWRETDMGFGDLAWVCDAQDCGATWQFTVDGPRENGVRYCPKCGRYITDVVRMEGGDDDDSDDDDA